jgi:hypothetical protein
MNLTLNSIIASSGAGGPDTDGQAFIDRVVAAGGSLTTTEQNAVKQLVVNLKAYGIWSSIHAAYPMIGNSTIAVRQNLKSASFTGTIVGTVAVSNTGITGDGSTGYMDTNYNIATNSSINSSHLSVYSRTIGAATTDGAEIGASTSRFTTIGIRDTFNQGYFGINGGQIGITSNDSHGFYVVSRTSSAQVIFYKNGSALATAFDTPSALISRNIFVCGMNNSAGIEYSDKQIAFASMGAGLTETQANNLRTAVQTFQTALSRNV